MCSGNIIAIKTFKDFVCSLINILNDIVPILMVLATVVFLWGVMQFIYYADNEEKRASGKMFIIYGLIGLFVIIAMWGLVAVLVSTFGLESLGIPPGPPI